MSRPFDVVCAGSATIDTIGVVERVPARDERVLGEPFTIAGGGPAATAAVTLARLGASVAFCGVVGDDEAGELVRAEFEREGVDTRWLVTRAGVATSRSVVLVERGSGARSIVATPSPRLEPDEIPRNASTWLHVDQHGYGPAAVALGADGGDPSTVAALSVDAGNPVPGLHLGGLGLYAPTVDSLRARYGADVEESLRAASADGARRVVATAGAEGSYVLDGAEVTHVPGHPVEVVSTLGAGDVFHGALLAGIVGGKDLVAAAGFAGAVAALACRGLDGRSRIPSRAEAEDAVSRRPQRSPLGEGNRA